MAVNPINRARDVQPIAAGTEARTSSLPPARLRQVLDRLHAGVYDRPEVLRHVAERLAHELAAAG
jgi:hypothetical protein